MDFNLYIASLDSELRISSADAYRQPQDGDDKADRRRTNSLHKYSVSSLPFSDDKNIPPNVLDGFRGMKVLLAELFLLIFLASCIHCFQDFVSTEVFWVFVLSWQNRWHNMQACAVNLRQDRREIYSSP